MKEKEFLSIHLKKYINYDSCNENIIIKILSR